MRPGEGGEDGGEGGGSTGERRVAGAGVGHRAPLTRRVNKALGADHIARTP